MTRDGAYLSLDADGQARLDAICEALGKTRFQVLARFLMGEWDATFGGEYADELTEIRARMLGE